MPDKNKIPVARPFFGGHETSYVNDAVSSREISGNFGKYISTFENKFAEYCGVRYGISTNNGTTALHVALASLGLGPGDEVLVQTLTNMATIFSICYTGAKPIAIDVEEDTWNLNPQLLEKKLSSKTRAIVVVHLFGHPVNMDPVLEFAKQHQLYVIEDAAQAHGAEYKGRKTGSMGDLACFSFYANKIITTGEGGMVVTNSSQLAEKVRNLHSLSYGQGKNKFMHESIGFNYRMSNVIAAIGCGQLEKIEEVIMMKIAVAKKYSEGLRDLKSLQLPIQKEYAKSVYWMYQIVLRGIWKGRRNEVMTELRQKGIETRESFVPFNQQEIFLKDGYVSNDDCPVANNIGANGFYLPSGPVFYAGEQERVIEAIRQIFLKN